MEIDRSPAKLAALLKEEGVLSRYFSSLSEEQQRAIAAQDFQHTQAIIAYINEMRLGKNLFF